ncbi:hypothetical protein OOZ54_13880 [Rhodopseudomonas palustris]|uniref:hypothetical protein n=1 Tax=Rhodopseudomonas palustris TaxID=1076 RepID=UPI0022F1011C|nr:hypothetical protein [Rhodopseudomonas palustris]WBU27754.1 hypothetical protein OOZ54_13880 [Rhodopseudomonas palustris]
MVALNSPTVNHRRHADLSRVAAVKQKQSTNVVTPNRIPPKDFVFPDGVKNRDRPLRFHWSADYNQLNELVGLPPCPSRKMERVMASIVLDVILSGPFRRTSYSRSKEFYLEPGRYRHTDYGYDTVVGAVDRLVEAGLLIEHHKVKACATATGWQSSFIGAPVLYQLDWQQLRFKKRPQRELIRLKDANGSLVDYRETRRTRADRKMLAAVNARIATAKIELAAPTIVQRDEMVIRFAVDDEHKAHAVYPHLTELYRVYNNSWTFGGRFYGGWWQAVRSADRKYFLINGEAVEEPDYEQLHPRLLYALAGKVLTGDAYTIHGWSRKTVKIAFNVLINASTLCEARASIAKEIGDKTSANMLIAAIKFRHDKVRDYFHSGYGIRLQNLDSEMCRYVLTEMIVKRGIVVLPVHDSFICPVSAKELLVEVMKEAFDRVADAVRAAPKLVGRDDAHDTIEFAPLLVNKVQAHERKYAQSTYRGTGGRYGGSLPSSSMPSIPLNHPAVQMEPDMGESQPALQVETNRAENHTALHVEAYRPENQPASHVETYGAENHTASQVETDRAEIQPALHVETNRAEGKLALQVDYETDLDEDGGSEIDYAIGSEAERLIGFGMTDEDDEFEPDDF